MSDAATDYLREISDALRNGYPEDCLAHAYRLAELLVLQGASPWIGRLRDIRQTPSGVFHGPLSPKRLTGSVARTWTTHYIACAGDTAYDPLAGTPVPLNDYSIVVFGREIPIEVALDSSATARCRRVEDLRSALRPGR